MLNPTPGPSTPLTPKQRKTANRIYLEYAPILEREVFTRTRDVEKAFAIVEQCFIDWLPEFKRLRTTRRRKNFLLQRALAYCEKFKKDEEEENDDEEKDTISLSSDMLDEMSEPAGNKFDSTAFFDEIWDYIRVLPPNEKDVMILFLFKNLSHKEISERMLINLTYVYKIIDRVCHKIRERFWNS